MEQFQPFQLNVQKQIIVKGGTDGDGDTIIIDETIEF